LVQGPYGRTDSESAKSRPEDHVTSGQAGGGAKEEKVDEVVAGGEVFDKKGMVYLEGGRFHARRVLAGRGRKRGHRCTSGPTRQWALEGVGVASEPLYVVDRSRSS
jgi:hypothetical protein